MSDFNLKEKINDFLFTEDRKPKIKAWAFSILVLICLLYVIASLVGSGNSEKTQGSMEIDNNIIIPREKSFNVEESLEYPTNTQTGTATEMMIAQEVRRILPQIIAKELQNPEERKTLEQIYSTESISQLPEDMSFYMELIKEELETQNNTQLADLSARLERLESNSGANLVYTGGSSSGGGDGGGYQEPYVTGSTAIIFDNSKPSDNPVVGNFAERSSLSYHIEKGVNAGTMIPGILETGAVSSGGKCPIKVTTTEDIYYGNTVAIPQGSYLIGYGIADINTRQVYMYLEKLVIGRREIGIRAHLIQENMQPGFLDKLIDKTKATLWKAAALDFCAAAAQSFKDTIYFVSDNGIPATHYPPTVNNAALDGVTNALSKYAEKITSDAAQMGYIMIVYPNKPGKIFLDDKIPLNKLVTTIN